MSREIWDVRDRERADKGTANPTDTAEGQVWATIGRERGSVRVVHDVAASGGSGSKTFRFVHQEYEQRRRKHTEAERKRQERKTHHHHHINNLEAHQDGLRHDARRSMAITACRSSHSTHTQTRTILSQASPPIPRGAAQSNGATCDSRTAHSRTSMGSLHPQRGTRTGSA